MAMVTAVVDKRVDPGVKYTRKNEANPNRTDISRAACQPQTTKKDIM